MTSVVEKLEIDLRSLSSKDKAALAHYLIEGLDGQKDEGVEEIWRKEAESRYLKYKVGDLVSVSGSKALLRARDRLK
jgi:hypothetical protein